MKRFLIYSLGLLVVTVLTLALTSVRQVCWAQQLPAVEVGVPDDGVFGLGGHYVVDKGLDRKNGYVMKARWASVTEVERLLAVGAIQVGLTTSESAIRANVRGIPIRLITPFMEPHQQVLVRKESPYKTVEDLKGKPIALTPEVTALYNMFDFTMRKMGYNIEKDFRLKKLGAPGIIAVLERGEVEGVVLWEAHVSRLLATGKYRVIMYLRDEMRRALTTPVKVMGWVGALEPWAKANQDAIPKMRASWRESWKGVQNDETHFRKYAKTLFALEKPDEVNIGWERTRQFLLPQDFAWPDASALGVEKVYLREGTEMGMFPIESQAVIDKLFVP